MAGKKPNPFSKSFEKKETKAMEKKESPKFEKKEKKMGTEKPMPFKCGGKVKGK
ncbi:MAG: hypothetical protein WC859_10085 [Elusimicrobiota bacterium]|jgi:hypothetical protein